MAQNIEIKAVVHDYDIFYQKAEAICNKKEILNQIDIYFNCNRGRLKLRETSNKPAEIISYSRTDHFAPNLSLYSRCTLQEPKYVARILSESLGIRGIIEKQRTVFIVGQTRIHLDKVNNLGVFAELEVVLTATQTKQMGEKVAQELMDKLGIKQFDLIVGSYIDLRESSVPYV